jgi:hypothetical protein
MTVGGYAGTSIACQRRGQTGRYMPVGKEHDILNHLPSKLPTPEAMSRTPSPIQTQQQSLAQSTHDSKIYAQITSQNHTSHTQKQKHNSHISSSIPATKVAPKTSTTYHPKLNAASPASLPPKKSQKPKREEINTKQNAQRKKDKK